MLIDANSNCRSIDNLRCYEMWIIKSTGAVFFYRGLPVGTGVDY